MQNCPYRVHALSDSFLAESCRALLSSTLVDTQITLSSSTKRPGRIYPGRAELHQLAGCAARLDPRVLPTRHALSWQLKGQLALRVALPGLGLVYPMELLNNSVAAVASEEWSVAAAAVIEQDVLAHVAWPLTVMMRGLILIAG